MIHHMRFTAQKIAHRLALIETRLFRKQIDLPPFRYLALPRDFDPPYFDKIDWLDHFNPAEWEIIRPNQEWGEWKTNFLLQSSFCAPAEWADAQCSDDPRPAALYLPLGEAGDFCHPEALVYIDGHPYAACDRYHQQIFLPGDVLDGYEHSLILHGWTGLGGDVLNPTSRRLLMQPCQVVQIDQGLSDFISTAHLMLATAEKLDEGHPSKNRLLDVLDEAFKLLDLREPLQDNFYRTASQAGGFLCENLPQCGAPMQVELIASGHAHIDVAWLWTLDQTRLKAGRTFHNVVRLMERYPFFHFTQSQPQLYEFVRQDYPQLFQTIRERVAHGQWEPIGGMWVEADCNISGSESLVRQFLLGRQFFRKHFGPHAESPVLWLPDVFGYAWNLPQLIQQAGMQYFFTIKIGWSQYNRLPYDTFWWQGLDGTRVLTHFSTSPDTGAYASTYNSMATPAEVLGAWENFQQKELRHPLLMAFGHGDGGGGPTAEMIENLTDMAEFPALPRVRQGSIGGFFQEVESRVGEQLPVWNGELYLELHRGTYTSQGRVKRANRRSEFLLHDAEFLATCAYLLDPRHGNAYVYPHEALCKAWELVCLNQFHDILPGSSIGEVYQQALAQYEEVQRITQQIGDQALAFIAAQLGAEALLVNPISFARHDLLDQSGKLYDVGELPAFSISAVDISRLANQVTPALGLAQAQQVVFEGERASLAWLDGESAGLENSFLRVEFTLQGDLYRIYDKIAQREVLPPQSNANIFQAFEDRPLRWDAWDIDIFYDDKLWLAEPAESLEVVENGPLRAAVRIQRRILNSRITQVIYLSQDSARLDFLTQVDWNERHVLLKVAFPLQILAPYATYEIQWGNVQRPTHRNTSWDWARFETAAQKWVDLSEGNYGVSLLNDSKYGHDIHDNTVRLSLLRSPVNPDPQADQGLHKFTYSLLPHSGNWDEHTIAQAYALNDTWIYWQSGIGQKTGAAQPGRARSTAIETLFKLVQVDAPNLVIETIKQAEDGRGIIVRLYESQRKRGRTRLEFAFPLQSAWQANLMEEDQQLLWQATQTMDENRSLELNYRPYEIVTLRLVFAGRV